MKQKILLFSIIAVFITLWSCSDDKYTNKIESKWKVVDKEEYTPEIKEDLLYSSIEELEKILLAPLFYFEKEFGVKSFSQKITYTAKSKTDESERVLVLNETAKYTADNEGNFTLSYQNDKQQGWEMIWKDKFLYKKMIGGEFTRTFSMGEHRFYKESIFKIVPEIYSIFRENGKIISASNYSYNGDSGKKIIIRFSDERKELNPLPEKKYLQNSYGIEEMKNDKLIADFQKKERKNISGELTLFVTSQKKVAKLEIDLNFYFPEDRVSFNIKGERELFSSGADKITAPQYAPEYHRRSLDAAKNIMEEEKKDGQKQ